MAAKKRSAVQKSPDDLVTLYSARGSKVTVPYSLQSTLETMGFSAEAPAPGDKDTPQE